MGRIRAKAKALARRSMACNSLLKHLHHLVNSTDTFGHLLKFPSLCSTHVDITMEVLLPKHFIAQHFYITLHYITMIWYGIVEFNVPLDTV